MPEGLCDKWPFKRAFWAVGIRKRDVCSLAGENFGRSAAPAWDSASSSRLRARRAASPIARSSYERPDSTLGNGNGSGGELVDGVSGSRPNILLIITDDQEKTSMRTMSQTLGLFKRHGVSFNHGYVTTPLCCSGPGFDVLGPLRAQPRHPHQQPERSVRDDLPMAEHLPGEAPGGRLPNGPVRQVPEQLEQDGRRQGRLRQVQGRLQGHRAQPRRARPGRPDHGQARQPVHQGPRIRRYAALDDDPGAALAPHAARAGEAVRERRRTGLPAADLVQRVGPLRQAALPDRQAS